MDEKFQPDRTEVAVEAAAQFFGRLTGLAFHDLANALAPARLLAELDLRSADPEDKSEKLQLLEQLEESTRLIGRWREILRGRQKRPARDLLEAVRDLLKTELRRHGAELVLDLKAVDLEVAAAPFTWMVAHGVMLLLDVPGTTVVILRLAPYSAHGQHFRARLRLQADGQGEVRSADGLFEVWCRALGARPLIAPGERGDRDPEWEIAL
jgi:hypothetical protein